MPHARLVEFAGTDRVPWGKDQDVVLDEVERFIDGLDAPAADDRALVTLLFTDIVGSTELAEQLGTAAGASSSRRTAPAFATSCGAIGAARSTRRATGSGGVRRACPRHPLRARHHGGSERDRHRNPRRRPHRGGRAPGRRPARRDRDSHRRPHRRFGRAGRGPRVADGQGPVAGSGIRFADRGAHSLKGISESWHLYAVES